jgi:flagellar hook assembly protein FlgD
VKFQELPLVSNVITATDDFIGNRFSLEECHPNPAKDKTTLSFRINSANHVSVNLYDRQGKQVSVWINGTYAPGEHKVDIDVTGVPAGNYIYQLKSGFFKDSKQLVITK